MSDKSVIIYSVMSLQTHMAFFVENWGTFRRICAITMNGRWFQALKMIGWFSSFKQSELFVHKLDWSIFRVRLNDDP